MLSYAVGTMHDPCIYISFSFVYHFWTSGAFIPTQQLYYIVNYNLIFSGFAFSFKVLIALLFEWFALAW